MTNKKEEQEVPLKTSPEWHDYIMSKFTKEEVVEGHPTCVGLRRVLEEVYGTILECQSLIMKAPTIDDRSATVLCSIVCLLHDGETQVRQDSSADVSEINTEAVYAKHSVSTAETRAEARALRKLLGIRSITAEEAQSGDVSMSAMTDNQFRGIENAMKAFNIDPNLYLTKVAGVSYDTVKQDYSCISHQKATEMLAELNNYHDDPVPEDVVKTT